MSAKINIESKITGLLARGDGSPCNPDILDVALRLVHYEGSKDSINLFIDQTFREGDEIVLDKAALQLAIETMDKATDKTNEQETIKALKQKVRELEKKLLLQ